MEDLYVISGIIGAVILFFLLVTLFNKARSRKESLFSTPSSSHAVTNCESLPYYTTLEYCVNGLQYQPVYAIEAARKLKADDVVYLVPEPDNRYDANAVRVETGDGMQIGYVPRSCSVPFTRAISNGHVTMTTVKEVRKNKAVPLLVLATMFTEKVVVNDPNVIDPDAPMPLYDDETEKSERMSVLGYHIAGLYNCSEAQQESIRRLKVGDEVYAVIDHNNGQQVKIQDAEGNFLGNVAAGPGTRLATAIQSGRLVKTQVERVNLSADFPSVTLCSLIKE